MAFRLTNAPATFQRLMERTMGELNLRECLIFLDDILIFSENFEDHLDRLEAVFSRLKQHGLKLKPSKCEFFKTSVKYLGHVVSHSGVQTDPDKIEALASWPEPVNVKELRSFLGFTGFLGVQESREMRLKEFYAHMWVIYVGRHMKQVIYMSKLMVSRASLFSIF